MSREQYVDWNVFENIPEKSYEITYSERNEEGTTNEITIEKTIKKFICQAPIGSGKSTALRKWIYNTVPNNKFILVVPTINIAMEFYSKLYVALNNNHPKNIDEIIKVCVKEGAFKEFKAAITRFVPVVITTFSTAVAILGGATDTTYLTPTFASLTPLALIHSVYQKLSFLSSSTKL